jgi:hypothetical protein
MGVQYVFVREELNVVSVGVTDIDNIEILSV